MQSELSATFAPLVAAGQRLLVTCVVAGTASLVARILHSRAKRLHYPKMPPRRVQLWTFAYDTVFWISGLAVVLMFPLFIQEFGS
jgi:hypothetical protein